MSGEDPQLIADAVTGRVLERIDAKFDLVYEKMDDVAATATEAVKEAAGIASATVKEAAGIAAKAVKEAAEVAEKRATEAAALAVATHKNECPLIKTVEEMQRTGAARNGFAAGEKKIKERLGAKALSIIGFFCCGGLLALAGTIKLIGSMLYSVK